MKGFFSSSPVIVKLNNKMEVHLIKDESVSTYCRLIVGFGSKVLKYLVDGKRYSLPMGTAHFLEHKIFANPDGDGLIKLTNLGLIANAHTDYNDTVYSLSGVKNMKAGIKLLLKTIDTPYFTAKNVIAEQAIIAREIDYYFGDNDSLMQNGILKLALYSSPVRNEICGSIGSIAKIDEKTLLQAYNHFYSHQNRKLIISGPIDLDEYLAFFKEYDENSVVNNLNVKPLKILEPNSVQTKFDVTELYGSYQKKVSFAFKYRLADLTNNLNYYGLVATTVMALLFSSSARLYEKLYDEGLIDGDFDSSNYHHNNIYLQTMTANSQDPHRLYETVIAALDSGEELFDYDEFTVCKRQNIGNLIRSLNDFDTKNYMYTAALAEGSSLDATLKILNEMTFEDVLLMFERIKAASKAVLYGI